VKADAPKIFERPKGTPRFRLPRPKAILSLLAAVATGAAFSYAHIPLAWVLGPLFATAILSIAGRPIIAPLAGRRLGQLLIGTSIGLNVTEEVLGHVLTFLPLIIVTGLVAFLFSAIVSVLFAWSARIDRLTAFFSMVPGGLSEMANIGGRMGAHSEPIAVAQALRVGLLVCVMPPLILSLGIHGNIEDVLVQARLPWQEVGLALTGGALGIGVAALLRLNNPWMIGALIGATVLTATGFIHGRLPTWLFATGQLLIGLTIGARFRREFVVRLPRLCVMSALHTLLLAALLFFYALLAAKISGLDPASTALGSSPGGLAEMAITAQTLHLSVGIVTAFHIARAFLVNGFTTQFYALFERIGLFNAVEALLPRR
jgi:uncharacterized protein